MKLNNLDWKSLFEKTGINKPIYYALSGSHLYGFNSPDSDIDIRGCHSEKLYDVLGLHREKEVRDRTEGDLDFVSFDIRKELQLVLANNSNVLEHIAATPIYKSRHYAKLKELANKNLSRLVAKPYWGMTISNEHKFLRVFNEAFKQNPVKKYLYCLRGLMAGTSVLNRHYIEPNIKKLNKQRNFQISIVDELIKMKINGEEKMTIPRNKEADEAMVELKRMFKEAEAASTLPPTPLAYDELNEFLIDIRMEESHNYNPKNEVGEHD